MIYILNIKETIGKYCNFESSMAWWKKLFTNKKKLIQLKEMSNIKTWNEQKLSHIQEVAPPSQSLTYAKVWIFGKILGQAIFFYLEKGLG